MAGTIRGICLDAIDEQKLADWWCEVLGYRRKLGTAHEMKGKWLGSIEDPSGEGPLIWINRVPEPKTVKNRLHFDILADVDTILALGATVITPLTEESQWWVLADPEGNEFCVSTGEGVLT
ncbi:VOC family protein [Actinoplanes sp. NPDC049265]|uniref:VOC family protein n=1 Tax=Actinoplanes sp. NPDC049265 TaxID=3363902 RepID=UPI00372493C0